mgnify:CR=1 FL=1
MISQAHIAHWYLSHIIRFLTIIRTKALLHKRVHIERNTNFLLIIFLLHKYIPQISSLLNINTS